VAGHLVGRPGEPADIAATVTWLASDDASFGQLFTVDGA
jgi:NAD(P)-dependent dehydrogenase (short-subunit alcohol dehydrogenase family)